MAMPVQQVRQVVTTSKADPKLAIGVYTFSIVAAIMVAPHMSSFLTCFGKDELLQHIVESVEHKCYKKDHAIQGQHEQE